MQQGGFSQYDDDTDCVENTMPKVINFFDNFD